jgi:hypothetical protein
MKKLALLTLILVLFGASTALSADVTLLWDPVVHPLLAGYKLHYGFASGSYQVVQDVGNVVTYTFTGLDDTIRYYFVATAYSVDGEESDYSNEVNTLGDSTIKLENLRLRE